MRLLLLMFVLLTTIYLPSIQLFHMHGSIPFDAFRVLDGAARCNFTRANCDVSYLDNGALEYRTRSNHGATANFITCLQNASVI